MVHYFNVKIKMNLSSHNYFEQKLKATIINNNNNNTIVMIIIVTAHHRI